MMIAIPPFGGEAVPYQSGIETGTFARYELAKFLNSDLYIGEELLMSTHGSSAYSNNTTNYSVEETKAAWRLIRSKLWRVFFSNDSYICVLTESYLSKIRQNPDIKPEARNFELLSFEDQIEEAKKLTLSEKCSQTLQNIYLVYNQTQKPFSIPYVSLDVKSHIYFSPERSSENGQAYGCNEKDAAFVYGHLLEHGFIEDVRIQAVNMITFLMTSKGRLEIERLEIGHLGQAEVPVQSQSRGAVKVPIDIFISHSSKDVDVASALIDVFTKAYNLPADKIRCTSVEGYKLRIGSDANAQLKAEVHEAKAFIGLITPASIESIYVLFELGGRWGANLHLAPVLASGADPTVLRAPLSGFHAANCANEGDIFQLVDDIAEQLGINVQRANVYRQTVTRLVKMSNIAAAKIQQDKQPTSWTDKPDVEPIRIKVNEWSQPMQALGQRRAEYRALDYQVFLNEDEVLALKRVRPDLTSDHLIEDCSDGTYELVAEDHYLQEHGYTDLYGRIHHLVEEQEKKKTRTPSGS